MPLNLPTSGGDFAPFIKYNAKAGRFYIRIEGQEHEQEVPSPTLVIDLANIKTGWVNFPLSGPPRTAWGDDEMPPDNDQRWKRGFKVNVYGEAPVGLREWMSNSMNCNAALVKMYDEWEKRPEAKDYAKVPWFRLQRVEPVQGQYGTNYEPVFELGGFTERAGRFPERATQAAPPASANGEAQAADADNPPPPNGPGDYGSKSVGGGPIDDEIPFAADK